MLYMMQLEIFYIVLCCKYINYFSTIKQMHPTLCYCASMCSENGKGCLGNAD